MRTPYKGTIIASMSKTDMNPRANLAYYVWWTSCTGVIEQSYTLGEAKDETKMDYQEWRWRWRAERVEAAATSAELLRCGLGTGQAQDSTLLLGRIGFPAFSSHQFFQQVHRDAS
jgi:hypothetical protein